MASPSSDHIESKPNAALHQAVLSKFQADLAERLNIEQMFILIDGVLPLEACLYYQVLPLFIEGSRLHLGMVSLDDSSAAEYVRRIISYHNYSLVPRPISSEALQSVLSAYLNYAGKQQSAGARHGSPNNRSHRGSARARTAPRNPNIQQTLVVDSPEDLNPPDFVGIEEETPALDPPQIHPPVLPPPSQPGELLQNPEATPKNQLADEVPPALPALLSPIPPLEIQMNHLSSPVELLATLAPKDLLQELLGRVLFDGIGRLYFERQRDYGKVLWSQNGVLQSVIERLDLNTFQGVINELKLMTHQPLIQLQKPKQVEIERLYQQTRLLLRFRFMLASQGEEATLQVLRGAALKFYQQQRLAILERDALMIAKQLQIKVNEIRDRARIESNLSGARLDVLPALSQLLQQIEEQLGELQEET